MTLFNRYLAGILILIPLAVPAASLPNSGFEQVEPSSRIAAWSLDPGSSPGVQVRPDTKIVHGGVGSIAVTLSEHGSATLISETLSLEVGHLYRLSGWIRTSNVHADPAARYPTAVPATLTMASFPFTNHSPTVGGNNDWTFVEEHFIATTAEDRVRLHLGYNGWATGTAWFDDLAVEPVTDIAAFIPPETVRWFGPGYRYDDRGWIFVHIEGEPYERGYQYGALVGNEIASYITKLGTQDNNAEPEKGWNALRFEADALFLRGYDKEYLTEMRGISDGAAWAETEIFDRTVDLLDIVTLNSVVDLLQLHDALEVTANDLTGEAFLDTEEELLIKAGAHKCSAFAATGPATKSGEVVFGQIFMWYGYTGVHWNVITDLVPTSGNRLVYHTFPGGIHSGADFYLNGAGIVIGETTVEQTPFEPDSTPQSNRIRKAAQYGNSIDEVVEILWQGNNGMYTNDWPMADVKTGEVAIFLLGTHAKKLWRTGDDPAPFGLPGFLWANNNNRDPEVRKEYLPHPEDRPYDLIFGPWNRDVAFNEFYHDNAGSIDLQAAVGLWASSPVNRAHACDGKITTSEMAREMVFLAHAGKVTLREKFPGDRYMPTLPGAEPHLSLGYSTVSPVFVTDQLQATERISNSDDEGEEPTLELGELEQTFEIDPKELWRQTVYPATDSDGWFVSASAAYWRMLRHLDDDPATAASEQGLELAGLSNRYQYIVAREDDLSAVDGHRAYDRFGPYRIPRIKGTFALHQLRLLLGNETFLDVMRTVHERFKKTEMTTGEFISVAEKVSGRTLDSFIRQWLEHTGLPKLSVKASVREGRDGGWDLGLWVAQTGNLYHLLTHVIVETEEEHHLRKVEIVGKKGISLHFEQRPTRVLFNALDDIPVARGRYYGWKNVVDDFHDLIIAYGTSRQIEANHTLARRWQDTVANAYIEILPPLMKDSEVDQEVLREHDVMILGQGADNSLLGRLGNLPDELEFGRNFFRWQGETYGQHDDGLILVLPNPENPQRVVYLVLANSALQLYRMTETYHRNLPSWARFEGSEVVADGVHRVEGFDLDL